MIPLAALAALGWGHAAYLACAVRFDARLAREWRAAWEACDVSLGESIEVAKDAIAAAARDRA